MDFLIVFCPSTVLCSEVSNYVRLYKLLDYKTKGADDVRRNLDEIFV